MRVSFFFSLSLFEHIASVLKQTLCVMCLSLRYIGKRKGKKRNFMNLENDKMALTSKFEWIEACIDG